MTDRPLKVAILCLSDNLGGAAVVTYRLMQALRSEGVDARMVVFDKSSNDENVISAGHRYSRIWAFMKERLEIAFSNGFSRKNLFKVSTASTGMGIHKHPWIEESDVIMLSWINQGLLSLNEIKQLGLSGKPIVWTMHDMWNLTGICHHAYECDGYKNSCGNCPFLTGKSNEDLSHKTWLQKQQLYTKLPITFVAVSNWLANRCAESSLMKNLDVRVIHNAFPINSFKTETKEVFHSLGKNITKVIVMGAARLDDPIKGLDMAIDALNHLFDTNPDMSRGAIALFFGEVRDRTKFDKLHFPFSLLGTINDGKVLRQLYASANVVLSTSLYETLPGTLIEGQAAGCIPVSFGRGGQADIIDHKVNGYIAEYQNIEDVAKGIEWALSNPIQRENLHEFVRQKFSANAVATRYIALFRELLANKNRNVR